jgi:hypothetical protein
VYYAHVARARDTQRGLTGQHARSRPGSSWRRAGARLAPDLYRPTPGAIG